jgi:hypothetical protein
LARLQYEQGFEYLAEIVPEGIGYSLCFEFTMVKLQLSKISYVRSSFV